MGRAIACAQPEMLRLPRIAFPLTAAILGSGLVVASCGSKKDDKPKPPPEAGYVVLQPETVPLYIELTGRTTAFESSDVRPQVAGLILARTFVEGSIVHKGQTLYKIDPSQYQAALGQAQANLASAQANAAATQAKAVRYKPLADIEAVAKQDYVDAKGLAGQAGAAVAQNRAAVRAAQINLGFTNVPAPITGRVGRSLVTTGGLVTVGQTTALTTIQRLDPMFVDIQQSSADLLTLRRTLATGGRTASSAAVTLELGDGGDYPIKGRVQFADAMVDPATGTVTLRASFANPRGVLLPGMFVRARLSQETARNAILAPIAGIARDPKGNATALVVGRDPDAAKKAQAAEQKGGKDKKSGDSGSGGGGSSGGGATQGADDPNALRAISRDVVVDRIVGDKWLVTKGLNAGDKLIVEGLNRVKPGQPIRPVPAGSKPAPPPASGDGKDGGKDSGAKS